MAVSFLVMCILRGRAHSTVRDSTEVEAASPVSQPPLVKFKLAYTPFPESVIDVTSSLKGASYVHRWLGSGPRGLQNGMFTYKICEWAWIEQVNKLATWPLCAGDNSQRTHSTTCTGNSGIPVLWRKRFLSAGTVPGR